MRQVMTADIETSVVEKTAIGFRSFRKPAEDGSLGHADAIDLDLKRDVITNFVSELLQVDKSIKKATIITTNDLPEIGRIIFDSSHLNVIYADTSSKKLSQAEMLNAFMKSVGPEIISCAIVSPSLIGLHKEIAARQILGLTQLFNLWEASKPGTLAMAGTLIEGEHDPNLVEAIISGTENLNLKNLWKVFPTNAMSLVRSSARFSDLTDNGRLGVIEIEGQSEKIGGNEDFYYAFDRMIKGEDCVVLINQVMPGERQAKIETVGKKVQRREKVYEIYAKLLLDQHFKENPIYTTSGGTFNDLSLTEQEMAKEDYLLPFDSNSLPPEKFEKIIEGILDKHLFFARIDQNGKPEIVLTRRQRSMVPSF